MRLIPYVTDLIREGMSSVSDDQLQRAITVALQRFSQDRPRAIVRDVVMTDPRIVPPLDDWREGFSQIYSIEAPVGAWPPSMLEPDSWNISAAPVGEIIRLREPRQIGEAIRVMYSGLHSDDSIPDTDIEAAALWAAAFLAEQLAALRSNDSAPTIAADSTDQANPAKQWAQRAKDWRSRYAALVGATGITGAASDKPAMRPAGAVMNFDLTDSRGRPRLYPRRRR